MISFKPMSSPCKMELLANKMMCCCWERKSFLLWLIQCLPAWSSRSQQCQLHMSHGVRNAFVLTSFINH